VLNDYISMYLPSFVRLIFSCKV